MKRVLVFCAKVVTWIPFNKPLFIDNARWASSGSYIDYRTHGDLPYLSLIFWKCSISAVSIAFLTISILIYSHKKLPPEMYPSLLSLWLLNRKGVSKHENIPFSGTIEIYNRKKASDRTNIPDKLIFPRLNELWPRGPYHIVPIPITVALI